MAFTRYHDDPCRIMKQLQESTDQGMYHLNVPGTGASMPFIADPHVRLQAWGANRHDQLVTLESELRGIQNKMSRNCKLNEPKARPKYYATDESEITAVPRSDMPAWELRGTSHMRWEPLLGKPQENSIIPFQVEQTTRSTKVERSF